MVGEGAANLRVLVFNVKGEDLLWLDKPQPGLHRRGGGRVGVARGCSLHPFASVAFWAPPRPRLGRCGGARSSGAARRGWRAFAWTPREFIDEGLLRFLFTDASDTRNQLSFVEERVRAQLRRWAVDVLGMEGAVVLRQPPPGGHPAGSAVALDPGERPIRDLASLVDTLEEFLDPQDESEPDRTWTGRVQGGTVSAFMRRLYAAQARLGHLVRAGASRRIDREAAQVSVVGIQSLHDLAQRFVVGALLQETFDEKERSGQRLPLSVIVLDELNKYAPREGRAPSRRC